MKIIIIGAGISGLSTYLFLKKHLSSDISNAADVTIQIYEAYDVHKLTSTTQSFLTSDPAEPVFLPSAIGNAIGISPNGLKVLRRLDKSGSILREVLQRGNPIQKWRMSNARGWMLADISTVSKTTTKDTSDTTEASSATVMVARQQLWEILRDEVLRTSGAIVEKRITDVQLGQDETANTVEFEDGTTERADLIIGADGLRSVVRRAMFQVNQTLGSNQQPEDTGLLARFWSFNTESSPAADYITPQYEGLVGVGGFIRTSELQQDEAFDPKAMNIVFGPNGFFGYGSISSAPSPLLSNKPDTSISNEIDNTTGSVSAWWSTFSSPTPYPYRQANTSTNTTTPSSQAIAALLSRHSSWTNPTIHRILTHTSSSSQIQVYPTWTTPELPYYHTATSVLVGDAAHALQPSSGQGASLALEDAETLSLLLSHHLKHSTQSGTHALSLEWALSQYTQLRRPRVHRIYVHSQKMSRMKADMGIVAELVMYLFIWLGSKVSNGGFQRAVLEYDVPGEVARVVAKQSSSEG